MTITIRVYTPQRDEPPVYRLWQRTLGGRWPIPRAVFHHTTVGSGAYQPGDHVVATLDDGQIIGFVATQVRTLPSQPPTGELMVLMVDPAYQRRGVGRRLLSRALAALKRRGVTQVQLGAGGVSYFWPGVPTNLPGAWAFFTACGWPYVEPSFDLIRRLDDYTTPPEVDARLRASSIAITPADAADVPDVLAFERRHCPSWLHYYEETTTREAHRDIILARDTQTREIVGASMTMDFRDAWRQPEFRWSALLGENVGGIGPLGVAEAWRGNGIGLALAARVTENLQARGLKTGYIGYTWLVDWYGKLGYRVWRKYTMSWKTL
jgi:beta-N-acetylhexosaminidase